MDLPVCPPDEHHHGGLKLTRRRTRFNREEAQEKRGGRLCDILLSFALPIKLELLKLAQIETASGMSLATEILKVVGNRTATEKDN